MAAGVVEEEAATYEGTSRRKTTVTSSLTEISTDSQGNKALVTGAQTLLRPTPTVLQYSRSPGQKNIERGTFYHWTIEAGCPGQVLKDNVNGFPPPRIFQHF